MSSVLIYYYYYSYPLLSDGLSFGQPLPFLHGLLLELCWRQLGLVSLKVNLELLPGLERGLLKRL